jgi:signal transduction histidine kinase
MDGLALTRALRELVYTRTTPVVLVTARGDIQQVIEGFDAGADDYITKPFHGRELLARVDVHLRIRRLMQHLAHQERLASLGVIAASVAHNVRNALLPLTSGLPSVRRRLSAAIDEGTAQMFDVMQDSAARIERLSIDLLDLSRIEKDQQGLFQPGAGLMSSVRLISVKLDPTVELTLDVDEETTLWGRAGDMNHVFLNLIDNAAHAVAGQKDAKLHVSGARVGDDYVIEVCDSGHGVTPNLRELVFDAFVTTRSAGAGTGLGLAIARDVVQQHQGTIRVDTAEIGGARFTLVLPIRAAAPPR